MVHKVEKQNFDDVIVSNKTYVAIVDTKNDTLSEYNQSDNQVFKGSGNERKLLRNANQKLIKGHKNKDTLGKFNKIKKESKSSTVTASSSSPSSSYSEDKGNIGNNYSGDDATLEFKKPIHMKRTRRTSSDVIKSIVRSGKLDKIKISVTKSIEIDNNFNNGGDNINPNYNNLKRKTNNLYKKRNSMINITKRQTINNNSDNNCEAESSASSASSTFSLSSLSPSSSSSFPSSTSSFSSSLSTSSSSTLTLLRTSKGSSSSNINNKKGKILEQPVLIPKFKKSLRNDKNIMSNCSQASQVNNISSSDSSPSKNLINNPIISTRTDTLSTIATATSTSSTILSDIDIIDTTTIDNNSLTTKDLNSSIPSSTVIKSITSTTETIEISDSEIESSTETKKITISNNNNISTTNSAQNLQNQQEQQEEYGKGDQKDTLIIHLNNNNSNGINNTSSSSNISNVSSNNNISSINYVTSPNQRNQYNNNRSNNNTSRNNHYLHTTTTFSLDKNEEFHFIKPPECPIFKPNDEEFKNPLAYISKIRPVAEKYGICKIKPPKTWTPPFTVDVDKLRFTPRVQRLNELEAKTRVKLNFLDQIAKFWELQGSSLKIPMVERKALDLYTLHRVVQEEGGIEQVTKERKWSKVAQRMGYPAGKNVGTILKGHYERILHPFDIFTSGKAVDLKLETEIDDQDYKPHGIVSRQQITPPNETTARRSKRFANSGAQCGLGATIKDEFKKEKDDDNLKGTEYRRLQIYGAGPKMAGYTARNGRSRMASGGNNNYTNSNKKKCKEIDPLAKYICHICNRGDAEETMLLCDGCDDSYHTFCLIPPLSDIPKGDWRCPKCVVEEVSKPQEAFGFEQASREYTLQQFGEMADQFKADYFNMSVHLVPTDLVEREFWRIVSSIDEDVTVEYGADLHTMDHGSGFPTKSSLYLLPGDQEYAESSWNLNNLPLLEESILGHINADISGMKVPWMYVGMCFATFCWHNEDHWSYSINYLHWGEPKTWYGVPGSKAEAFEETMKSAAPELFQSQPDLLHQLVTIMNPNILMNSGVPVYRTDQHAGEFVITFPRAYHAGFNQGYNFAEAVNFAPADWMKMGRECINHYSTLRRFCVFSHDELVCKMALDPDRLNLGIATACYLDMAEMVDSEKKLRKSLLEWGVTQAEREPFELIPDDERQCESCKTTCFLSAVSCSCTQAIVCLRHYTELCECPPGKHTLKYRYTLDELPLMLKKLKVKAESFENWLSKVRDVLDPNTPTTITLEELQELAQEAEDKKFPSSVLLERLNSAVLEAEKCVTVIQQLDINKMRTRTRNSCESAKYKLTLDELELFVQEIDNLCCIIQEGQSVRELQKLGKEFAESAKIQLSKPLNKSDEKSIEKLIEDGSSLCIELHELKALKDRLTQVNFYNRVKQLRESQEKKSVAEIQALIKEGVNITPDYLLEKQLLVLHDIVTAVSDWEIVAKKCFESGTQHELPEIELLLERADEIQGILPSQQQLKDAVRKTKEWLSTVDSLQSNENYPYFHTLENVVNRGKSIPFQLEELKRMEEHLKSARQWKERTARTFLKKQTTFTLMDVLSPRAEPVMLGSKVKKKSMEEQFTEDMGPAQMVNAFKNAEEKELREMRELRKTNMEKNPQEDKYCICKKKFQGHMYHCQLCKDWFHEGCVPPPKNTVRPRPTNTSSSPSGSTFVPPLNVREKDRESKYLCQSCMRSRRPRLETILSLLVSLQRLPIRLPEGEALQCLTERAMNWQDRARQAFATEDVASALAALSIISQKINDNHTPRTNNSGGSSSGGGVNTNNEKSNLDLIRKTKTTRKRRSQVRTSEEDEPMSSSEDEDIHPIQINNETTPKPDNSPSSPTKIEHAYSVPPPSASATLSPSYNKVSNSNLGNPINKSDMPLIKLNKVTRETLENLMMEGDLLEVSLDETLHIWRILNAAKPSISDLAYIQHRYNIASTPNDILVSNMKKRRSDDNSGPQATKRAAKGVNSTTSNNAEKNTTNKVRRGRKMKMITKDTDNSNGSTDIKKRKRGKKIQQEQVTVTASTSDDDEECSAPTCARPSGREVDWVQCDGGCNKWFHMFCVGLDKHQIKPDDDYICKRCKKSSPKSSPSSTSTTITTTTTATVTVVSSLSSPTNTAPSVTSTVSSSTIKSTELITETTTTTTNSSLLSPTSETVPSTILSSSISTSSSPPTTVSPKIDNNSSSVVCDAKLSTTPPAPAISPPQISTSLAPSTPSSTSTLQTSTSLSQQQQQVSPSLSVSSLSSSPISSSSLNSPLNINSTSPIIVSTTGSTTTTTQTALA